MRGSNCLGIFLDISGAFDNLQIHATVDGMKAKNICLGIINRYSHYLENRTIVANIGGVTVEKSLNRGTPQGGVLSPLVWNLAIEDLLEELNTGPIRAVRFADDVCILLRGIDPNSLVDLAQIAVDKAIAWGDKTGLQFNATKTAVVFFSHKNKLPVLKRIRVNDQLVDYSDKVKY